VFRCSASRRTGRLTLTGIPDSSRHVHNRREPRKFGTARQSQNFARERKGSLGCTGKTARARQFFYRSIPSLSPRPPSILPSKAPLRCHCPPLHPSGNASERAAEHASRRGRAPRPRVQAAARAPAEEAAAEAEATGRRSSKTSPPFIFLSLNPFSLHPPHGRGMALSRLVS
jgi:hypothetical protein